MNKNKQGDNRVVYAMGHCGIGAPQRNQVNESYEQENHAEMLLPKSKSVCNVRFSGIGPWRRMMRGSLKEATRQRAAGSHPTPGGDDAYHSAR